MFFLIGVLILIGFLVFVYLYFNNKIKNLFGDNLFNIIKKARLENEVRPKSLSSMDSVYLNKLMEDFPEVNINQFKSDSEKYIIDYFSSIEKKDSSRLKGKLKSLVDSKISDLGTKSIKFNNLYFHNRV